MLKSRMNPRIITGTAKNLRLQVPASARPITDRIKQSLFDTLGERIKNVSVLDLFAGSGSIGLEALSRGAAEVTFVEKDREANTFLKNNIAHTKLVEHAIMITRPVEDVIKEGKAQYDLIFADPPFATAHEFPVYLLLKVMKPDSLVIFRKPTKAAIPHIPKSLNVILTEKYGESEVLYIQRSNTED